VVVLRMPDGGESSSAPFFDESVGTLPIDADGDVTLQGTAAGSTLATSLDSDDVAHIFEEVNRLYDDAGVTWVPSVQLVGPSTASCIDQSRTTMDGKYKVRTHDYLVKYFGTINKSVRTGREERSVNLAALVPAVAFVKDAFNVLFIKYLGIRSQGVVIQTPDWIHGPSGVKVAVVGEWSNKFTEAPIKRPTVLECGTGSFNSITNCGVSLAYTTAHELGHLIGLSHTDPPSLMSQGGGSAAESAFSPSQVEAIKAHFARSHQPTSQLSDYVTQTGFEDQASQLGMEPLDGVTPGTAFCPVGPVTVELYNAGVTCGNVLASTFESSTPFQTMQWHEMGFDGGTEANKPILFGGWQSGSNWAARLTQPVLNVRAAGLYRFSLKLGDADTAKLLVGGHEVIRTDCSWGAQRTWTGVISLPVGTHEVVLQWADDGWTDRAVLSFMGPDTDYVDVPIPTADAR